MKILLTNDDGIYAPGLWAAARALATVGELFVAAPDREQSGVGASLTLHAPVKVKPVEISGGGFLAPAIGASVALPAMSSSDAPVEPLHPISAFAVEGTPGDSCILGLEKLVGPVDLVVSGINSGSNLGWDALVSGTVGAAWQGYMRGYPTIAISVGSVQNPRFDGAAALLRLLAAKLAAPPVSPPVNLPATPASTPAGNPTTRPATSQPPPPLLNINVPSLPLDQIAGVELTRPGGRSYSESVREEGTGHQKRYWIARNRSIMADNGEGSDMWAARNNRIAITPLQLNLGDPEALPRLKALLEGVSSALLGKSYSG